MVKLESQINGRPFQAIHTSGRDWNIEGQITNIVAESEEELPQVTEDLGIALDDCETITNHWSGPYATIRDPHGDLIRRVFNWSLQGL